MIPSSDALLIVVSPVVWCYVLFCVVSMVGKYFFYVIFVAEGIFYVIFLCNFCGGSGSSVLIT